MTAVMHLFTDEFAREFLKDLAELKRRGVTDEAIARGFGSPIRFTRIADSVLFGMKRLRTSLEEQREMVLSLMSMARLLKHGSEYNLDGRNEILSSPQVAEYVLSRRFRSGQPEEIQLLQRLCGALFAYTEAIFFRAHDITKELHGLYPLEGGDQLLVREYRHLSPTEIWPDIPLLPYRTIVVSSTYGPELHVDVDFYNHLYLRRGNYLRDLRRFVVEGDGRELPLSEIPALLEQIALTVAQITRRVDRAPWQDRAEKYAEIFWYRKRPLCDLLGVDWRVPELVRRQVRNGEINQGRMKVLQPDSIARLIRLSV